MRKATKELQHSIRKTTVATKIARHSDLSGLPLPTHSSTETKKNEGLLLCIRIDFVSALKSGTLVK